MFTAVPPSHIGTHRLISQQTYWLLELPAASYVLYGGRCSPTANAEAKKERKKRKEKKRKERSRLCGTDLPFSMVSANVLGMNT